MTSQAASIALTMLCLGLGTPVSWGAEVPPSAQLYQQARAQKLTGKVHTVRGPIEPDQVGFTLMHEHLYGDLFDGLQPLGTSKESDDKLARFLREIGAPALDTPARREFFARPDVTIDMINKMRLGWMAATNMRRTDEAVIAKEIAAYTERGGRTFVDLTTQTASVYPEILRRFSEQHGLQIVMSTGWYRWPFHPEELADWSVEQMTARLVNDIVRGRTDGIRAGILGEIGLDSRSQRLNPDGSPKGDRRPDQTGKRLRSLSLEERDRLPLTDVYDEQELRVLRAAARASRLTGAAVSLHAAEPWLGYLSIFREEGAALERVIISHAHEHFIDRALLERALRLGVVLEADYMLQFNPVATRFMPKFDDVLDGVAWAIRNGHRDQILLSLDLGQKTSQQKYGGGGYTTLHDYVFPYLRQQGVSEEDIQHIMVSNPRRLLTFVEPRPPLQL